MKSGQNALCKYFLVILMLEDHQLTFHVFNWGGISFHVPKVDCFRRRNPKERPVSDGSDILTSSRKGKVET